MVEIVYDETDLHPTRNMRKVGALRADVIDNFIAIGSILTYIGDVVTDALVAKQYYSLKQWDWFALTLTFVIIPSIIMQVFSIKWHHDDAREQSWLSIILHILQLAPVERYCQAFWYGIRTICRGGKEIDKSDYTLYLTSWRDATMLRLVETFLESAPQVVLQLYVLSRLTRSIVFEEDWETVIAAVVSILSLAWSIVSYTHALRLCAQERGLSICGYIFQVLYRLSMIASRIVAMVLFASEYSWALFIVVTIHWLVMIIWLHTQKTNFCESDRDYYEKLFIIVLGFVYVFCFINAKPGATRKRVTIYYVLFFVENSLMIAAWYPLRRSTFGILEYGGLSIVWGAFLLGLASMLAYYKLFHPKVDITAGWCNCLKKKKLGKKNDISSDIESDEHNGYDFVGTPKCVKKNAYKRQLFKKDSIDVEISPRISTSQVKFIAKKSIGEEVFEINPVTNRMEIVEHPSKSIGEKVFDSVFAVEKPGSDESPDTRRTSNGDIMTYL